MERHLRAQRARAEQALERVAQRLQLRWSFRTTRGQIVTELLTAALDADLVALGAMSSQMIRRAWLGSTAQAIMARTARPVLITPRGATVCSPIAVVYNGSPGSMHALALAKYVCDGLGDGELVVLLIADDAEQEEGLRRSATARLESSGASARFRWVVEPGANELARALRAERAGTLVFASDVRELDSASVRQLLERMDLALLLVGVNGEGSLPVAGATDGKKE